MDHPDWDLCLQHALLVYRTIVTNTTSFTPFSLMFGLETGMPVDLVYGPLPNLPLATAPEYAIKLQNALRQS